MYILLLYIINYVVVCLYFYCVFTRSFYSFIRFYFKCKVRFGNLNDSWSCFPFPLFAFQFSYVAYVSFRLMHLVKNKYIHTSCYTKICTLLYISQYTPDVEGMEKFEKDVYPTLPVGINFWLSPFSSLPFVYHPDTASHILSSNGILILQ